jgi:hypothetical protein
MTKPLNLVAYKINLKAERAETTRIGATKRKQVQAAGGNCLLCKHTKLAIGKRLVCRLKDKLVTQYNYCDKFIEIKPKGDNDD